MKLAAFVLAAALAAGSASAQTATANLQGNDAAAWHNDPAMHRFYDLTRTTLGGGAKDLDFPAYRDKSYAIFRDFAASHGMTPEAMVDHLKLIPGQMVEIVKADPRVLDSYESFRDALFGPP
jgi:hypothetical protein